MIEVALLERMSLGQNDDYPDVIAEIVVKFKITSFRVLNYLKELRASCVFTNVNFPRANEEKESFKKTIVGKRKP